MLTVASDAMPVNLALVFQTAIPNGAGGVQLCAPVPSRPARAADCPALPGWPAAAVSGSHVAILCRLLRCIRKRVGHQGHFFRDAVVGRVKGAGS